MHIILIGMPGAGKSTLAKKLATTLGWPTVDTDWEIEKRAGSSIASLFAAEGEAAFRELEADVLRDTLAEAPNIIATGGGLPIQPGHMSLLKEAGLVVYLPVSQSVALARLEEDAGERPLLAGNVDNAWATLLQERLPIYTQAHIICQDADALLEFCKAAFAGPAILSQNIL
jgi:shikimate kinase